MDVGDHHLALGKKVYCGQAVGAMQVADDAVSLSPPHRQDAQPLEAVANRLERIIVVGDLNFLTGQPPMVAF